MTELTVAGARATARTGATPRKEPTTTATGSGSIDVEAAVESVEKCLATCRTLTHGPANRGADDATDVVVSVRVFTGGEGIWNETQVVGAIDAESRRSGISRDVDVGVMGGREDEGNDGAVVIELAATAGDVSETFEFERTIAA